MAETTEDEREPEASEEDRKPEASKEDRKQEASEDERKPEATEEERKPDSSEGEREPDSSEGEQRREPSEDEPKREPKDLPEPEEKSADDLLGQQVVDPHGYVDISSECASTVSRTWPALLGTVSPISAARPPSGITSVRWMVSPSGPARLICV